MPDYEDGEIVEKELAGKTYEMEYCGKCETLSPVDEEHDCEKHQKTVETRRRAEETLKEIVEEE